MKKQVIFWMLLPWRNVDLLPWPGTLETTRNRTLAGEVKLMNFYPFE